MYHAMCLRNYAKSTVLHTMFLESWSEKAKAREQRFYETEQPGVPPEFLPLWSEETLLGEADRVEPAKGGVGEVVEEAVADPAVLVCVAGSEEPGQPPPSHCG